MISDWLQNAEKKSSRVDKLCCACALSCKNRHNALSTNGRAVGCVFDLILVCTCFWPQTDQVYLFVAAAQQNNTAKARASITHRPREAEACSTPMQHPVRREPKEANRKWRPEYKPDHDGRCIIVLNRWSVRGFGLETRARST